MAKANQNRVRGEEVQLVDYGRPGKKHGVIRYYSGSTFIILQFQKRESDAYVYEASKVGLRHLMEMKRLAVARDGLTTYLNQNPEIRWGFTAMLDVIRANRMRLPPRLSATRAAG